MSTQNSSSELLELKRYIGVLIENVDSKLDLVLEGQEGLQRQIDINHEEFKEFRAETNDKFEVITEALNEFKEEVGAKFEVTFEELNFMRSQLGDEVGRR
jgi:hypothetical protein